MSLRKAILFAGIMAISAGISAVDASAKCTRLAFSVNDYGKEGPIRDAKALLDTYIAKWTAERGIVGYRTGKKTVTCELFLDLIVFDEYTCRAEASVCWGGAPAKSKSAPSEDPAGKSSKGGSQSGGGPAKPPAGADSSSG